MSLKHNMLGAICFSMFGTSSLSSGNMSFTITPTIKKKNTASVKNAVCSHTVHLVLDNQHVMSLTNNICKDGNFNAQEMRRGKEETTTK